MSIYTMCIHTTCTAKLYTYIHSICILSVYACCILCVIYAISRLASSYDMSVF